LKKLEKDKYPDFKEFFNSMTGEEFVKMLEDAGFKVKEGSKGVIFTNEYQNAINQDHE